MAALGQRRVLWIKVRLGVLVAGLVAASVAVAKGAWDLGVVRQDELRELSNEQYKRRITLPARRGMITDRHGEELAVEVEVDSVYADTRRIADPAGTARELSKALGMSEATVRKKLYSKRHFIWIDRRITPEQSTRARALDIPGIEFLKESKRFYPSKKLASHVIGFAGIDSNGLEGIELKFEEQLKGQKSAVEGLRDARGHVVFADSVFGPEGVVGNTVELTIDRTLQHIAEEELRATVRTFNAKGGHIIIMDPKTGEIMAMANWPEYNPNAIGDFPAVNRRNRAVLDVFEPGSTFKVFTLAAALNTGAIRPDERIFCERGRMTMGDKSKVVIHDDHRDGLLTPTQCLKRSSNICFAKMSMKVGKKRLYNYLRRFGFGEVTRVDLPFESKGVLRHYKKSREVDAVMVAFGQGVGVTGIQMATALSALANGGVLMNPLLVRRIISPNGETLRTFPPTPRRRVVSRYTARLVGDIMTSVTEEGGTGAEGALKGFLVAGKTGTAQKAVGGRGYDENKWIASFIGFVPAENPRLAVSVVIDEPLISHYGGTVAAPALRRVADEALKYLGVSPRSIERSEAIQRVARHRKKETSDDPADEAAGQEEVLTRETPGPNQVLIPDLTGMTMKQVVNHLSVLGLRPLFQGTGFAAEQIPPPLSAIDKGAFVQVNFLPETKKPKRPDDEAPADESAAEDAKEGADGASSERVLDVRPDEDRG